MEIFGGFMVMASILGFFLAVLWFILPFVIFAMKGKIDRIYELLEKMDRRIEAMEGRVGAATSLPPQVPRSELSSPDNPIP